MTWAGSIQQTIDVLVQWMGLIGGGMIACWFLEMAITHNWKLWKVPTVCAILLIVFILALEVFKLMSLPGVP